MVVVFAIIRLIPIMMIRFIVVDSRLSFILVIDGVRGVSYLDLE